MDTLIKILVVEDEMIIGATISMFLTSLGYEVTGMVPRAEEALLHVRDNPPDIILLDIQLKGKIDGIEMAKRVQETNDIPIIYLTANADEATFNRAKSTRPAAFISKPFRQLDLQRAIELTITRMAEQHSPSPLQDENNHTEEHHSNDTEKSQQPFILKDRIFVKNREKMTKILFSDILFIEADRNYSRIFTLAKEYLLSITLKMIEEKLPANHFLRIHRSYIINLLHVDEVSDSHVMIAQKPIPLSGGLKDHLLERIQTL